MPRYLDHMRNSIGSSSSSRSHSSKFNYRTTGMRQTADIVVFVVVQTPSSHVCVCPECDDHCERLHMLNARSTHMLRCVGA